MPQRTPEVIEGTIKSPTGITVACEKSHRVRNWGGGSPIFPHGCDCSHSLPLTGLVGQNSLSFTTIFSFGVRTLDQEAEIPELPDN